MPENSLPFILKSIPCRAQASKGRVGFSQQFGHKKRPILLLTSPGYGRDKTCNNPT
jgi:hypothetical protein